MMLDVEFTLLLIYLAIGIATTVSVDAIAIAMIDEDVYGLPDNAPSTSGWKSLLWKCVAVMAAPLVLAVFVAIQGVMWMEKRRTGIYLPISPVPHSKI